MLTKSNQIIGKRIYLARQMTGRMSQKKLQAQLTNKIGKSGRLSNYERGEARPKSEVVEKIAKLTGTSPCWLLFGHGPIRSDSKSPPAKQAVRHQNLSKILVLLEEQTPSGSNEKNSKLERISHLFLKKSDKQSNRPTAEQLLHDRKAIIDDTICANIEKALKKPQGWMSEQHVDTDPVLEAFPPEIREILELYSETPKFRPYIEESVQSLTKLLKGLKALEKSKKKKK